MPSANTFTSFMNKLGSCRKVISTATEAHEVPWTAAFDCSSFSTIYTYKMGTEKWFQQPLKLIHFLEQPLSAAASSFFTFQQAWKLTKFLEQPLKSHLQQLPQVLSLLLQTRWPPKSVSAAIEAHTVPWTATFGSCLKFSYYAYKRGGRLQQPLKLRKFLEQF